MASSLASLARRAPRSVQLAHAAKLGTRELCMSPVSNDTSQRLSLKDRPSRLHTTVTWNKTWSCPHPLRSRERGPSDHPHCIRRRGRVVSFPLLPLPLPRCTSPLSKGHPPLSSQLKLHHGNRFVHSAYLAPLRGQTLECALVTVSSELRASIQLTKAHLHTPRVGPASTPHSCQKFRHCSHYTDLFHEKLAENTVL